MADDLLGGSDPALSLDYYPYLYHTVLRQSDGRGNGHVANGKISMLADDAREEVHAYIMGDRLLGHSIHLLETNFRFLREVTYPGDLTIGMGITAIGTSSMRQVMGMFRDGRCYVLSRVAHAKTAAGRSVPFTAEERTRAERYMIRG